MDDLLSRIKEGNEQAYKTLFDIYYSQLSMFARKYIGDTDIAREIVQEVFVKIYENRKKILINVSIKSYLYQSVKNACLNYLKKEKVHNEHHQQILYQNKDQEVLYQDFIETSELEVKIFDAINELPERCREVFTLNRIEGKRNKEIAQELKISIRTVETQISNALKHLRTKLKDYISVLLILVSNFL